MLRRFTLAFLAAVVSAGSVITVPPEANAQTRRYCENHRCDRQYYRHNRDRNPRDRVYRRYRQQRYRRVPIRSIQRRNYIVVPIRPIKQRDYRRYHR
ncbi:MULTISPECIES: hypothetical protein [Fischerella]|nr:MULTISPECIES: hypothetical protein [Fischerella]MBD2434012.1 hypothetical protein [Fischerella sp. FACHB-380]